MGVLEKLSRKTGVIVGDDLIRLFEYAQEKSFAIPAIVSSCYLSAKPASDLGTMELTRDARTSPLPRPWLLPSRRPATKTAPLSSRFLRVVPPTSLARYVAIDEFVSL